MSTTLFASREDIQNIGQFQSLCKILLSDRYREYLDKPLSYWILPTDRRLPLALLNRELGDLLNTDYEVLAKTPGIGQKKMAAFVNLLARAAEAKPEKSRAALPSAQPTLTTSDDSTAHSRNVSEPSNSFREFSSNDFDSAAVSELQWSQWRACVVRHGLGGEKLGRFAPSLQNMTKVIWNTPLAVFTGHTLAEMRSLKTYGKKRVHAILEVFHGIHAALGGLETQPYLSIKIAPRWIDQVESWVGRNLQTPGVPDENEILNFFIRPLLRQIEIDVLPQIVALAENRLGVFGQPCSVRHTARIMGLTRARVYQLLNEINDIMTVRWPLGRHQVHELRQKFERESTQTKPHPNLVQFYAAVELTFPGNRRGADGSLEYLAEDFEDDEADLLEV